MSLSQLYNVKVNIIRITRATDGLGGRTESETTLHTDLPCRINWVNGNERIMFNKTTYYRDAKLYCRVTDITVADRVVYEGIYYDIVNVSNVDNMNRFLTIEMKRREPQ